MSLPRTSLVVAGVAFFGFGAYLFYAPEALTAWLGLAKPNPVLAVEFRAMYGGLQVGLGVYFLFAASRGRWVRSALAAQIAVFGGLAAGRLLGMMMAGLYSRLFLAFAALELLGALLGSLALRRARQLMDLNYARRL